MTSSSFLTACWIFSRLFWYACSCSAELLLVLGQVVLGPLEVEGELGGGLAVAGVQVGLDLGLERGDLLALVVHLPRDPLDQGAVLGQPFAALLDLLDRPVVFVLHLGDRVVAADRVGQLVELRRDGLPEFAEDHGSPVRRTWRIHRTSTISYSMLGAFSTGRKPSGETGCEPAQGAMASPIAAMAAAWLRALAWPCIAFSSNCLILGQSGCLSASSSSACRRDSWAAARLSRTAAPIAPLVVLEERGCRGGLIVELVGQSSTFLADRPQTGEMISECRHEPQDRELLLAKLGEQARRQQILLISARRGRGCFLCLAVKRLEQGPRLRQVACHVLPRCGREVAPELGLKRLVLRHGLTQALGFAQAFGLLGVAEVAGLEHAIECVPGLVESRPGGREMCTGGLGITFDQSLPQLFRELSRLGQRQIGIAALFVEPQSFLAMFGRLIADC